MAGIDINSDIESDSDSVLEINITSDGAIRPFMFEPQHGSSSEEEHHRKSTRNRGNRNRTDHSIAPWPSGVVYMQQLPGYVHRNRKYLLPGDGCFG